MDMRVIAVVCGALLVAGCAEMGSRQERTATAQVEPLGGSGVGGNLNFTQHGDVVRVTGEITGHSKGPKGFHIHEKGDCSDPKGMSTGGHFNPGGHRHGGPYSPAKHAGDLGNINFNAKGVAKINFTVGDISLDPGAPNSIIGRAVIVHSGRDDEKTNPTGNAGGRVACGLIR